MNSTSSKPHWVDRSRSGPVGIESVARNLPPMPYLSEALAQPGVASVTMHETMTAGVPWTVTYSDGSSCWGVDESYLSGALYQTRKHNIDGRQIKITYYSHSGW